MDIYTLSVPERDLSGYGNHTDALTQKVTNCQDPKNHYYGQKLDLAFEIAGVILHICAIYFAIQSKNMVPKSSKRSTKKVKKSKFQTSCLSSRTE